MGPAVDPFSLLMLSEAMKAALLVRAPQDGPSVQVREGGDELTWAQRRRMPSWRSKGPSCKR